MNKRLLWTLIVTLSLVACRDKEQQPTTTGNPVNGNAGGEIALAPKDGIIAIQFAVEDYELAAYEPLIEAFEAENPDIQIKLVSMTEILSDLNSRDDTEMSGVLVAQAADVFSNRFIPPFYQDQIALDLTPLMNADANFNPDNFYVNTLQEINGRIYTLPISINFGLIFYNKDIFDTANLAYPQQDWTWNNFQTTANALTIRDGNNVTQWGFVKPFSSWITLVETQLASPLIDVSTKPPTFRFGDIDVTAVARQYETLFLSDQAAFAAVDATLIEEGKVAMWPGSYHSYPAFSQNLNVGIITYPIATTAPNHQSITPLGVDGFTISAGSLNPEAAWKWVNFLSIQGQPLNNATLSARISVNEINQFWQNVAPELVEPMRHALQTSTPFIPNPGYEFLDEAMNAIIRGDKTVEGAFAQAQLTSEQLLATASSPEEEAPTVAVNIIEDETNPDLVSINFWLINQDNIEGYRVLADQFETDTNIQINFRFPSFNGGVPNLSSIAQANDCFRWSPLQDSSYQTSVLSLDPFIAADPSFDLEDFFPIAIDQFTVQGQLWGLPADLNPIIIEFNKDIFDAASIPYPIAEWTIDDFLNTAVALTEGPGHNKQYGFVSDAIEVSLLENMMDQLGATFIDNSIDPPTIAFTAQETIDAMSWYTNLSIEYGVKPIFHANFTENIQDDYDEYLRLLGNGQAAMWTASLLPVAFDMHETVNIGAVPLPTGANNAGYTVPEGIGYYISANTLQRQACWEWLKVLTKSAAVLSFAPARRSVAESTAFVQQVGEERAAAYLASLTRINTSFLSDRDAAQWWMFPYKLWLARAHDQITINHISVEEAMVTAQQTFDAYRACVIESDALNNRDMQNQCAIEIDPNLTAVLGE